jgi:hypothetical protein
MPLSQINNAGLTTGSPSWDSSGNVTVTGRLRAAQPYAFVAKNNAAITGGNVIVFNVVNSDPTSLYNSTNGRFTAPVAGKYILNHGLFSQTGNAGWVAWRINGTAKATTYTNVTSGYASIAGTFICDMQAGDYADLFVQAGSYSIYGTDALQCWAQFMLLS